LDDLNELFGTKSTGNDLVERLITVLDRQTDHKLTPHFLLGFLGMFNMLSIMSLVHGGQKSDLKEVTGAGESGSNSISTQTLTDTLSSLMNTQGQGTGQPDLLGLLGNAAAKKKINPSLLLTLFSLLNNQVGQSGVNQQGHTPTTPQSEPAPVVQGPSPIEKKPGR
jgi:hypothetical protein